MTPRIRPAGPADRPFVVDAARRLATFHPPAWRSAEEIVAGELRSLEAFFATPSPTSALLIAEGPERERLGFAYLEELRDYFTLEAHGHIGMLVVREMTEGQGVGGALMRAAESWARERGYRKLTLTVFGSNRAAQAIYEHLGYGLETLRYVKVL